MSRSGRDRLRGCSRSRPMRAAVVHMCSFFFCDTNSSMLESRRERNTTTGTQLDGTAWRRQCAIHVYDDVSGSCLRTSRLRSISRCRGDSTTAHSSWSYDMSSIPEHTAVMLLCLFLGTWHMHVHRRRKTTQNLTTRTRTSRTGTHRYTLSLTR